LWNRPGANLIFARGQKTDEIQKALTL
jgi:hypothetical protein